MAGGEQLRSKGNGAVLVLVMVGVWVVTIGGMVVVRCAAAELHADFVLMDDTTPEGVVIDFLVELGVGLVLLDGDAERDRSFIH